MPKSQRLSQLADKLDERHRLSAEDRIAILRLPHVVQSIRPNAYLFREAEPSKYTCSVILSGYAYRQKSTADGTRQILSLNLAGDILGLEHLLLDCADHSAQALTPLVTAEVSGSDLSALLAQRRSIGKAILIGSLIDAAVCREWVVNVGRRNARQRIAHLLCEFATRLDAVGLSDGVRYELPMTQDQLADAVGLTPVHVNRTLKALESENLIVRDKHCISFNNWDRIRNFAGFNPSYLYRNQDCL